MAAALAAARTGAQTLLLEKECALGGLATLGLIVMYLPLCDGYGHQVIGGIGEELLRKSVEGGSPTAGPRGHVPPCWNGPAGEAERTQTRFRVDYDAAPMMLTLERLLREAGVSIWYDTRLCAAQSREGKLSHVIVENKSGRLAIAAQAFVDATGDADLCFLAGERTESYLENRRSGWYFSMREGESAHLHPLTDPLKGPCPPGSRFYRLSGSEVSAYVEDMHDMIHAHASGQEGAAPFLIPALSTDAHDPPPLRPGNADTGRPGLLAGRCRRHDGRLAWPGPCIYHRNEPPDGLDIQSVCGGTVYQRLWRCVGCNPGYPDLCGHWAGGRHNGRPACTYGEAGCTAVARAASSRWGYP